METKTLTCIGCPLGCSVTVEMDNGMVTKVTGNTCRRGDAYARREVTHPTRIVTSTVRVTGGDLAMLPVKTESSIPKEKIMEVMRCMDRVTMQAPVHIGDVVVENAAGTGVNLVAAREIALISGSLS